MILNEFLNALPGKVISKRISQENIKTPQHVLFLTAPCRLGTDYLYLIEAASAEAILPECSAQAGATILCSGAVGTDVLCQIKINLICTDCGLPDLHNYAAAYLAKQHLDKSLDAEQFRHRFAEIIEGIDISNFQTETICATFPKMMKNYYCVIYIQSPNTPDKIYNDSLMRDDLEKLFREDNVTGYNGETVVIHSYNSFTHPPELPMAELTSLLKKYGASAGVSNGNTKKSRLKLMYYLARKALESGIAHNESGSNIHFYDDTMLFSIVALAASAYIQQFVSDDIILLSSPIPVNLIKHDPKGKRNLLETLFQYITNGKSTNNTAKAMHLHRNTVQNRITLIKEIIGEQFLSDGISQAKLIITYYIMQYYNNVLRKEIELSPLRLASDDSKREDSKNLFGTVDDLILN